MSSYQRTSPFKDKVAASREALEPVGRVATHSRPSPSKQRSQLSHSRTISPPPSTGGPMDIDDADTGISQSSASSVSHANSKSLNWDDEVVDQIESLEMSKKDAENRKKRRNRIKDDRKGAAASAALEGGQPTSACRRCHQMHWKDDPCEDWGALTQVPADPDAEMEDVGDEGAESGAAESNGPTDQEDAAPEGQPPSTPTPQSRKRPAGDPPGVTPRHGEAQKRANFSDSPVITANLPFRSAQNSPQKSAESAAAPSAAAVQQGPKKGRKGRGKGTAAAPPKPAANAFVPPTPQRPKVVMAKRAGDSQGADEDDDCVLVESPPGPSVYVKLPDQFKGPKAIPLGQNELSIALSTAKILDKSQMESLGTLDADGWIVVCKTEEAAAEAAGKRFSLVKGGKNYLFHVEAYHVGGPQVLVSTSIGRFDPLAVARKVGALIGTEDPKTGAPYLPRGTKFWAAYPVHDGPRGQSLVLVFALPPGCKKIVIPIGSNLPGKQKSFEVLFRAGDSSTGCSFCEGTKQKWHIIQDCPFLSGVTAKVPSDSFLLDERPQPVA